jgi:Beta-lactamase superfamily domain
MKTTRRNVLGLLAGAATVVGVPSFWIYRMKTYAGPVSDHFDGTHFFDPDGAPPKSLGEVLRWQFGGGRQRHAWPEQAPSPYADTPPARVTGDKVRFSFVGHASWLIQTSGLNILIDPVWSERAADGLGRTEAPQRSRHRVRCAASNRYRAGVAWPL